MEKAYTFIKYDSSSNWSKADKFIPKENEIIIYTDLNQKKIGDGKTLLNELPFIGLDSWSIDGTILIINSEKVEIGGE